MRPLYTAEMTSDNVNQFVTSNNCKERNMQKDQDLFTAGEAAKSWYILVRGTVKGSNSKRDSWALKNSHIHYPPLDCIGLDDCLRGGAYTSTTTATSFSVVYQFDIVKTKALMRDHSAIRKFVNMLCTEHIVKWKLSLFSSLRRLEVVQLVAAGTICEFDNQEKVDRTEYFEEKVLLLQGSVSTVEGRSLDIFTMQDDGEYRIGANSTVFLFPHLIEDEQNEGQYRFQRGNRKSNLSVSRRTE
jgi:CRP-like cAMP-binding protein